MNKKIPDYLLDIKTNIKLLAFVALVAMVLILFYTPFGEKSWMTEFSQGMQLLYSAITMLFGVFFLTGSRLLLCSIGKKHTITVIQYAFWLIGEIVLIDGCYTLFSIFVLHDIRSWYIIFRRSLFFIPSVLFFPYLISYLYFDLQDKNIKINDLLSTKIPPFFDFGSSKKTPAPPTSVVNFVDEKNALKLSIKAENVYYIETFDNYVKIYYQKKDKISRCILRNSMKKMEELLRPYHFVRCHRTYMVNLDKVQLIKKEKDGFYIDMNVDGVESIPISKTYAEEVKKIFIG